MCPHPWISLCDRLCIFTCSEPALYLQSKVGLVITAKFSIQYLQTQFKSTTNGSSMTKSHWRTFFRTIWFAMCFWIQSQSLIFFSVRTIKVHQRIQEFKEDTRKELSELKENKLIKNKLLSDYQKKKNHEYKHELNGEKNSRICKQNSLKQYKINEHQILK